LTWPGSARQAGRRQSRTAMSLSFLPHYVEFFSLAGIILFYTLTYAAPRRSIILGRGGLQGRARIAIGPVGSAGLAAVGDAPGIGAAFCWPARVAVTETEEPPADVGSVRFFSDFRLFDDSPTRGPHLSDGERQ
jgi:hypothetical protein